MNNDVTLEDMVEAAQEAKTWNPRTNHKLPQKCDECGELLAWDRTDCPVCGHDWQEVARLVDNYIENEN